MIENAQQVKQSVKTKPIIISFQRSLLQWIKTYRFRSMKYQNVKYAILWHIHVYNCHVYNSYISYS